MFYPPEPFVGDGDKVGIKIRVSNYGLPNGRVCVLMMELMNVWTMIESSWVGGRASIDCTTCRRGHRIHKPRSGLGADEDIIAGTCYFLRKQPSRGGSISPTRTCYFVRKQPGRRGPICPAGTYYLPIEPLFTTVIRRIA